MKKGKIDKYRIENIQIVYLNSRKVKLFKAFEYNNKQKAYIFIGQFEAPAKTSNKNLENFIK